MRDFIDSELKGLERFGLRRQLRWVASACGPEVDMEGRRVLQFSSNNYLGLATHPRVKRAAALALEKYGAGAGASRLISGSLDLHRELEEELAGFKGAEAALVFATGSMANLGVLPCLAGPRDAILLDSLVHATLHDGARLSRAEVKTFRHNDLEDLRRVLEESSGAGRRLICVDGVFSMDGDAAPLPGIVELARRHGALTLVDEAHATGVMGPEGRGTLEHFGMDPRSVDVQIGTLSKALGSLGGFAACSRDLRELLVNKSRSFLFATALPAACAAAALEALRVSREQPEIRKGLWERRARLASRLHRMGARTFGSVSPILPVNLGRPEAAVEAQKALWEEGIYVPAIRPPTVPRDSCRLRVSLMATHTEAQVDRLADALERVLKPA